MRGRGSLLLPMLVMAAVLVSLAMPSHVSADEDVERSRFVERVDAQAVSSETTRLGFGKWRIDEQFSNMRALPGSSELIAVHLGANALARIDPLTGEYELGDALNESVTDLEVTADGQYVYALLGSPGEFIDRFTVEDLAFDRSISTGSFASSDMTDLAAFPDSPDLVLVAAQRRLAVLDDGVALPDQVLNGGEFPVTTAVVVSDARAVGRDGGLMLEIVLTPTGVDSVSLPALAGGPGSRPRVLDSDRFVIDGVVVESVGFAQEPATDTERAVPDPTRPVQYLVRDGRSLMLDASGNVLVDKPGGCVPQWSDGLFLGDGLFVTSVRGLNTIEVTDLHLACGSYGDFVPVDPDRVFDSRAGSEEPGAGRPLRGGTTTRVEIHGDAGVPENGVESVVLNVTAVRQRDAPSGRNYLTVWPAGFDQPTVSNLNLRNGETVGNMVTVSTAAGGFVDIYSDSGTVDVTVDVLGYFSGSLAPSGGRFLAASPSRAVDTRRGLERVNPRRPLTVTITNAENFYADFTERFDFDPELGPLGGLDVSAALVNVTAVQPTDQSFFKIFPLGGVTPDASSMNFDANRNTNRLVTVKLDSEGRFTVQTGEGASHVTVDLVGVYLGGETGEQDGRFVGLVPFRELDTRVGSPFDGDGSIPPDSAISLSGYPVGITLAANLTAIRTSGRGYLSTGGWASLASLSVLSFTSSLNYEPGENIANHAIITPSDTGEIGVYNSVESQTHVALDIFGFYTETDNQVERR